MSAAHQLKNHDLAEIVVPGVKIEKRPATTPDGGTAKGLYNAWIWLDNPGQYNSYTTDMVKGVILAFRAASNARDVSSVVFTGVGDKAFCTGGNTKEYAEYYAGHPQEYRQYMRLFNDMVSAILACDKPVRKSAWPATSPWRRTSRASARPARSTDRRRSAVRPIFCRS